MLQVHASRKKKKKAIRKIQQRLNSQDKIRMAPKIQVFFYRCTKASCQIALLSTMRVAPHRTCARCYGLTLNASLRVHCPTCRINTPRRARLRPTKSLRIPAIQTAVSSHCCSQKKPSKALGSILRGSGGAPAPKLSRHLMRTLPGACNTNNTAEIYILHIYTLSHKHTHTHFMIVQMHNHKFYLIYLSFFYPTICFFVCF